MSRAQVENKVAAYLRKSQAVEDQSQQPITGAEMQAEMERMARNTKQPEVLRELFAALGNDPSVIAECVARPVLAQRLVAHLSSHNEAQRIALVRTQAAGNGFSITTSGKVTYTLPEISNGGTCVDDTWTSTSFVSVPAARQFHTAVWTGSEMIVWGGNTSSGFLNTGGRYSPATDSWISTSTTNAPTGRWHHTAVWTGSEMIVWGERPVVSQTATWTRAQDTIPRRTFGQLPALSTRPLPEGLTRQCGPVVKWSSGADIFMMAAATI
jgi:hypothetical protein